MKIRFVYVPCASLEEAKRIGKHLVEEKLAACVNIVPQIWSYYVWQGQLTEDTEAVLIIKTAGHCLSQVMDVVSRLHSYTCPAILSWEVTIENEPYAKWFEEQIDPLSYSSRSASEANS